MSKIILFVLSCTLLLCAANTPRSTKVVVGGHLGKEEKNMAQNMIATFNRNLYANVGEGLRKVSVSSTSLGHMGSRYCSGKDTVIMDLQSMLPHVSEVDAREVEQHIKILKESTLSGSIRKFMLDNRHGQNAKNAAYVDYMIFPCGSSGVGILKLVHMLTVTDDKSLVDQLKNFLGTGKALTDPGVQAYFEGESLQLGVGLGLLTRSKYERRLNFLPAPEAGTPTSLAEAAMMNFMQIPDDYDDSKARVAEILASVGADNSVQVRVNCVANQPAQFHKLNVTHLEKLDSKLKPRLEIFQSLLDNVQEPSVNFEVWDSQTPTNFSAGILTWFVFPLAGSSNLTVVRVEVFQTVEKKENSLFKRILEGVVGSDNKSLQPGDMWKWVMAQVGEKLAAVVGEFIDENAFNNVEL